VAASPEKRAATAAGLIFSDDGSRCRSRARRLLAAELLARVDCALPAREMEETDAWDAVEREARAVSAWLSHLYESGAWTHAGSLAGWREAEGLAWGAMRDRAGAWLAAARRARAAIEEGDGERGGEREEAPDGLVHWSADMADWLWIRFGPPPEGGRSRFGLADGGAEDRRDDWFVECGGKRFENGASALRARRHPDVDGAFVLVEPWFEKARYAVRGFEDYLSTIIPDGGDTEVFLLRAEPVTVAGRRGVVYADLGSDGEHLLDLSRPWSAVRVPFSVVWASDGATVADVLGAGAAPRPR
jgi:hypothetical protein